MSTTEFPDFFEAAPTIVVRDALADFLGAARGGSIEYHYADAVRLAGHSCPTVASAWLMARAALRQLFAGEVPQRGEIKVDCRETRDAGVTGVMAAVFTLVTGAADEGGFRGLGANFRRRGLLRYGQALGGEFRLTRLDNGAAVEVSANPAGVPGDPRMQELMPLCVAGQATPAQGELFAQLWQDRVRRILERADDPALIEITAI